MLLLILAVAWAAVLVPPYLRARAEGRPADSIGSFRKQLRVLQRTAPTVVAPANTMRTRTMAVPHRQAMPGPSSTASRYAFIDPRRVRTLKRRRDVFMSLLGAMGTTLVLGALPALRVLWALHLVLDVLFVVYVAALVRVRNIAAEREMKLRFMPAPRRPGPAIDLRDPRPAPALALRRSAN